MLGEAPARNWSAPNSPPREPLVPHAGPPRSAPPARAAVADLPRVRGDGEAVSRNSATSSEGQPAHRAAAWLGALIRRGLGGIVGLRGSSTRSAACPWAARVFSVLLVSLGVLFAANVGVAPAPALASQLAGAGLACGDSVASGSHAPERPWLWCERPLCEEESRERAGPHSSALLGIPACAGFALSDAAAGVACSGEDLHQRFRLRVFASRAPPG